jgi:Pectate lyase superfamily protein
MQNVLNVKDYGAVGDGLTNDLIAFRDAMKDAIAGKIPLYIPSSNAPYYIEPMADKALEIDGDLVIFGDGRYFTTLKFGPDTATSAYAAFSVKNGVNFELRDLRVDGPTKALADHSVNGLFFDAGRTSHKAHITRVDIKGFSRCLMVPSGAAGSTGELFLTMHECDLEPGYQHCVAFFSDTAGHKRLHIYDCYLHDNKDSHLVYCHPHNSVHVENCRFDGATEWAWQFQGTEISEQPEYQRFIGCWFGQNNSRGIITHRQMSQVQMIGCTFKNSPSIQIRSNILIDGCYFTTSEAGSAFIAPFSDSSSWRAVLSDCIFVPKATMSPQVDFRHNNIEVIISNCHFHNEQPSNGMVAVGGEKCNSVISNCFFQSGDTQPSSDIAIRIAGGVTQIKGSRFIGRFISDRGVIVCDTTDTQPGLIDHLEISDCVFDSISMGSILHIAGDFPASWSGKIFGHNNTIHNFTSPHSIFSVFPDVDALVFGRFYPRAGVSNPQDSLTATSVMKVNSNYDTYYVRGSAQIETINWWDTSSNRSNRLFNGRICFIFEEQVTFSDRGNIKPKTLSARFPGEVVELIYVPELNLWWEK